MFFGICLSAASLETPKFDMHVTSIKVGNCLADDLFVTGKALSPSNDYDTVWDYYTYLHAKYEGNPNGGNVDFAMSSVDFLRLKRRKSGTYKWLNLHEVQIGNSLDFHFEYFDRLCRAKQSYDYALVCVSGGVESNFITNTIVSDFDGLFVCEKDKSYQLVLNLELTDTPLDTGKAIIRIPGRRYPFIINNNVGYCSTGTIKGTFIQEDPLYGWTDDNIEQGWKYRNEVNEYLNDGKAKLIKCFDGRMFLSDITSVSLDYSKHNLMPIHSIEFIEVGNPEEVGDLYDCGLIDCDSQRTSFVY